MDGVEVSVKGWSSTLVNVSPCTCPSCFEEQSHVNQSRCVLASSTNFLVLMCPARCGHCKAFGKWNGFGDDVIAEQPSHSHLVIHNTVCHVTPCVFLSSEPWLKQCAFRYSWFLNIAYVHYNLRAFPSHPTMCHPQSPLRKR